MLGGMDALMERFRRVIIQHRHRLLADDWPPIHAGIHKMNRAAGDLYPVIQRLLPGLQAREGRQQ